MATPRARPMFRGQVGKANKANASYRKAQAKANRTGKSSDRMKANDAYSKALKADPNRKTGPKSPVNKKIAKGAMKKTGLGFSMRTQKPGGPRVARRAGRAVGFKGRGNR